MAGEQRVRRPVALTIAGSDCGGGAGIQADLKAMALHGVFAASVVTSVTAQDGDGVRAVHAVPARMVAWQLRTVLEDLPVAAIKTGMLWSRAAVLVVARALDGVTVPVVVDPVLVASGGQPLLQPSALTAVVKHLLPRAALITPNLAEAAALTGSGPVTTVAHMKRAARALVARGAGAALVKGGHLVGRPVDVYHDGRALTEIPHPRVRTRHGHGTGCLLSAAIAARLARGEPLTMAVHAAVADVAEVIAAAAPLGGTRGPADPLLAPRFGR